MRKCSGKKICIICEGYEELEYFEALVGKGVFSRKYDFITVNSKFINLDIKKNINLIHIH